MGRSFANYSEAAIDEIFRQIDANDDGTITQEEFREAFGRSSALRQAIGEGPNYK
jgi:Ca2+-binding EF-hand superfamily protein